MTTTHEHAVAIDTAIADALDAEAKAARALEWEIQGLRRRTGKQSVAEALAELTAAQRADYDADNVAWTKAVAASEIAQARYDGWSRFFLVKNNNGHIHRSMSCSTCFSDTQYGWLVDLSGLTEAEAVEKYGEILCSICYPSAPVEWTNGTSKVDKEAKAKRAEEKLARDAAKERKYLQPGGAPLRIVYGPGKYDNEKVVTIAAAKAFLTDSFDRYYSDWRGNHQQAVAAVLAERLNFLGEPTTAMAQLDAARKRASKRH